MTAARREYKKRGAQLFEAAGHPFEVQEKHLLHPMKEPKPASKLKQRTTLPPVAELDRQLILEPETGILRWRTGNNSREKAAVAGWADPSNGYRRICLDGTFYWAHRVIYKMHYRREPPAYIDHRNGEPSDNRPCNLRPITQSQNLANSKPHFDSTSGVKGVSFVKGHNKWHAYINLDGKRTNLGYFKTLVEAAAVVRAAREKHHGEFARHS